MTDLFIPSSAVRPKITQAQCKLLVFSMWLEHNLYVYINVYVVANSTVYILQKTFLKNGTKSSGEPKINQMSDFFF